MARDPAGLIDYAATLDCVHCGLCLPACPTYQETGREASSPRGRIYLMRGVAEGRLSLDAGVRDEMDFCLACRACESACPAGVRYGHLIESMRAEINARGARSPISLLLTRSLLRGVIGSTRALRALVGALRLYQRSGLQRSLQRAGLLRLVPGLARADAMLPRLGKPSRPPLVTPAIGRRRGRVAFFAGCIMPEIFGRANDATIQVLAENGYEVVTARGQRCCGALHLHSGDPVGAERLMRRNSEILGVDSVDALIINSAGCGAALKECTTGVAPKVRDICEFLDEVGLRAPEAPLTLRVAYDDPCHLLHAQGISHAPRALLRSIPGVELLDLPGTRDCCGAAGTYSLTQPELSERLLERKVQAVRATSPDVVATGNPGCMLQISAGLRRAKLAVEVLHPVELLARSYAAAEPRAQR